MEAESAESAATLVELAGSAVLVVPTTLIAFGLVMYGMRGEPDRG